MSDIPIEAAAAIVVESALAEPPTSSETKRPAEASGSFGIEVQYTQMQEARRQWERFIWQSPIITTTLVGVAFAVFVSHSIPSMCGNVALALGLALLSAFTFVIGLWGHRSRLLLRATERTLEQIELDYFAKAYPKYPFQLNDNLGRKFDRLSSTVLIVRFMFVTAGALALMSGIEMTFAITGRTCEHHEAGAAPADRPAASPQQAPRGSPSGRPLLKSS